MSYFKELILAFFWFLFPALTIAQESNYIFEHFDISDGLANNTIYDIFQDSKGFIWFSTEYGASRFDGYEFVNYRKEPQSKNSLINSCVFSINEDKDGNIYFATKTGLSILNQTTQKYYNYKNDSSNILSISGNEIREVIINNKNQVWVLSLSSLCLFEKKKRIFANYIIHNSDLGQFYAGIIDNPDNLWISGTRGLLKYNYTTNKFETFDNFNMSGWGHSLYKDSKGNIWNATRINGLFKIAPETGKVVRYYYNPDENCYLSNSATCVTEDFKANIWIGTENDGIAILNPHTGQFQYIKHEPDNEKSLSSNIIYSLLTDRVGNIWVGTFRSGVSVHYPNKFKFKSYKPILNKKNSLSHNQVFSIFEDKEKNIWIGTDGGGVNLSTPDMKDGNFVRIQAKNHKDSLHSNIIKCITQLDNGEIWLGTYLNGIEVYHPQLNKFSHIKSSYGFIPINSNNIWSFSKSQDNRIWIASLSGGINTYNCKKRKFSFVVFNLIQQDYSWYRQLNPKVVYTDKKNDVWVGTERKGLYKFDKTTNVFMQYAFNNNKTGALSSNDIQTIYMDNKKRLWIGTNGSGLNLLNPKNKTFANLTEKDGLPNNIVNDILEDSQGNLWISTGNGLTKFNPENKSFKNYDQSDGLQGNQFNYGAALKASDGRMYFGGVDGFSVFHPDSIQDNKVKPDIIFTDFLLANRPVIVGAKGSPLTKSISETKKLTLSYNQTFISFKYTAVNFINAHKNQYAYMLEGLDENWHYVGNRREISFRSIPPGEYILRVKASNNDGIWNETGISLAMDILPPFWATWWFRITMILFAFLSISAFYINRLKQMKRRNVRLEIKVKERTKDLSQANTLLKERQEEILQQNEEILKQKNIVTKQKESIIDSINYAQQIQKAVLPTDNQTNMLLNEHFILYQPKDIVSGDFYWIKKINNQTIVATADCTGHGVPGAFMSMLGVSYLNEIVSKKNIDNPAEILNRLRKKVKNSLHQNDTDSKAKDGMDMSLYTINETTMELQFSGAFNPIYIIRNNIELIELKADRQPVAIYLKESDFTNHQYKLQKGDCIYSFSDGYADQFGGDKGYKLMTKNLKQLILQNSYKPMMEQKTFFQDYFNKWKGANEQVDDILLIGLRINKK